MVRLWVQEKLKEAKEKETENGHFKLVKATMEYWHAMLSVKMSPMGGTKN